MNMFRNLIAFVFLAYGLALWFLKLESWTFLQIFGPTAIEVVDICYKAQPFSTIVSVVIAVALFMTRKIY